MAALLLDDDCSNNSGLDSGLFDESESVYVSNAGNQQKSRGGGLTSAKSLIQNLSFDHGILAASAAREKRIPFNAILPKSLVWYFTAYAKATKTSVDTLIVSCLAGVGGVVGRGCLIVERNSIGVRYVPANLFYLEMASTNNGKSSAVSFLSRRPIKKIGQKISEQTRKSHASGSRSKTPKADTNRQFFCNTSTYSAIIHMLDDNQEVFVSNDEAGSTMVAQLTQVTKGANLTRALLMAAFTGEAYDASYADIDVGLEHPYITYLANVQEYGMMLLIMQFCLDGDGFLDRFIHVTAQLPYLADYLLLDEDREQFAIFEASIPTSVSFQDFFDGLFDLLIAAFPRPLSNPIMINLDAEANEYLDQRRSDFVECQKRMNDLATLHRNTASVSLLDLNIPLELKHANSKMGERMLKLAATCKIIKSAVAASGDVNAFLNDGDWKLLTANDLRSAYTVLKACDEQVLEYIHVANHLRKMAVVSSNARESHAAKKAATGAASSSKATKAKHCQNTMALSIEQGQELTDRALRLTGSNRSRWMLAQILKMPGFCLSEVLIRKYFANCDILTTDLLTEAFRMAKLDFPKLKYLGVFKQARGSRHDVFYKLPPKFVISADLPLLDGFITINDYVAAFEKDGGKSCYISGLMSDDAWATWLAKRQDDSPFSELGFVSKIVSSTTYDLKFGEIVVGPVNFSSGHSAADLNESLANQEASEMMTLSLNEKESASGNQFTPMNSVGNSPASTASPLIKKSRQLLPNNSSAVFLNEVVEQIGGHGDAANKGECSSGSNASSASLQKQIGIVAINGGSIADLVTVECYKMPLWKDPKKFAAF